MKRKILAGSPHDIASHFAGGDTEGKTRRTISMNRNSNSTSISIPLPILAGLIVAVALFAGGLNVGGILSGQPSFFLASSSVDKAGQVGQGQGQGQGAARPASMPAGSSFLYQGSLKNGGTPANGLHDLRFTLYDAPAAGTVISTPVSVSMVITDGLFTLPLDFGPSAFNGDERYVQVEVRQSGGGSYEMLTPRQPIAPAPYAMFALQAKPEKNVVTVAKGGGQFTSIQAALDSITDNSATNRYVVRVGPGVYTERVTMKEWVDIEGSGENNTTISWSGSGSTDTGTLVGASHTEVRHLTVRNTGGSTYAAAIYNYGVISTTTYLNVTASASGSQYNMGIRNALSSSNMNNVTASASDGVYNTGVYNIGTSSRMSSVIASASGGEHNYGVYNNESSPSMNNVTVSASGASNFNYGVYNTNNSSPSMNNVTVSASGGLVSYGVYIGDSSSSIMSNVTVSASGPSDSIGVYHFGSPSDITSSKISGGTHSIVGSVRVGASQLVGGPAYGVTCAGVYDENYVFYASTCP